MRSFIRPASRGSGFSDDQQASGSNTIAQCLLGQGVDAFALGLRGNGKLFMQIRRNPQVELA
jgi:hypothetical protein